MSFVFLTFGGSFYPKIVEVFYQKSAISEHLHSLRMQGKKIGLVPTMGALHVGHLTLIDFIDPYCDVRVCSVFVNPTQFNNKEDLLLYPRTLEQDLLRLEKQGCDVAFVPSVEEMYGEEETWHLELGALENLLEGSFARDITRALLKLFTSFFPLYSRM